MSCSNTIRSSLAGISAALAGVLAAPVWAADDRQPEGLQRCASIEDASARLECFDRYTGRSAAPQTVAPSARPAPDEEATEPEITLLPAEDLEDRGIPETADIPSSTMPKRKDSRQLESSDGGPNESIDPLAVGPESPGIKARVIDFQRLRRIGKVRITLDNGQIWQEIDGESFRGSIAEGTEVTIVERRFSGHKMILPDRSETIGVRRLR